MRRKKIQKIQDVKETVNSITSLIPKDVFLLKKNMESLEKTVKELHRMRHVDYMESRRLLLEISKGCMDMRNVILETHKIFTEENKKKINDKL